MKTHAFKQTQINLKILKVTYTRKFLMTMVFIKKKTFLNDFKSKEIF